MGIPLVTGSLLSPTTRARIAHCGAPVVYVSDAGQNEGHWACGSSWCTWCADRRRKRARRIIERRCSGDDGASEAFTMVTLTLPHQADLSAEYLREQIETVGTLWRDALSRVRWGVWRSRRGDPRAWEKAPPPGTPKPHPVFASTWRGRWDGTCDRGIWVREITAGGFTKGWHVHIHAIVATRADAEMLNAAWQAACADAGAVKRWASTKYSAMTAEQAARYVAKYLTKEDLRKIPKSAHAAYIEGSKGMRRADAWGAWRPLGLSAKTEQIATHIAERRWSHAVELADYYGETALARWLRTGRPPQADDEWREMGAAPLPGPLLALLTHTTDVELLAESKLAALAVARSMGRTRQIVSHSEAC